MKKILVLIAALSMVMLFSAGAAFAGPCVDCHTMHNSQNGATMQYDTNDNTPKAKLLRGSCLGCHANNPTGGSARILTNAGGQVPQVAHNVATALAGGNFTYTITGGVSPTTGDEQTAGHNVLQGTLSDDDTILQTPPGDELTTGINNTLSCSGTTGCHGDRAITGGAGAGDLNALNGAHHDNATGTIDFTEAATAMTNRNSGQSFRFLLGVAGFEDADWHNTVSNTTDHNEYSGATSGTTSTISSPGGNTISGLCAECHGNFHGDSTDIGVTGGWIRHPTDILLTNSGEYTNYTSYDITVPVGRPNSGLASASGTVTPGTDMVICLSCHVAHASAYQDALRWDYSNIVTGQGGTDTTRCFKCHRDK